MKEVMQAYLSPVGVHLKELEDLGLLKAMSVSANLIHQSVLEYREQFMLGEFLAEPCRPGKLNKAQLYVRSHGTAKGIFYGPFEWCRGIDDGPA